MEAGRKNKLKIFAALFFVVVLYYTVSIIIFRGDLIVEHHYSLDSKRESIENGVFISDKLDIKAEGDSLKSIPGLEKKFYINKSTYQKFYGFLISVKKEDENYRRISWEEPIELSKNRNWIITNKGEYNGEAFYSGYSEAKVGDTLILIIKNPKTGLNIGSIKIKVK